MSRIFIFIIKLALFLGIGEVFVRQTYLMAQRAQNAFQHDQLSYAKFTDVMIHAKPRPPAFKQNH